MIRVEGRCHWLVPYRAPNASPTEVTIKATAIEAVKLDKLPDTLKLAGL